MTRNILDLTKKSSSNNLLVINASLSPPSLHSQTYLQQDYDLKSPNPPKARARNPLPIIEPGTGREIVVETARSPGSERKGVPPSSSPLPKNGYSSAQERKPLQIINPKTGEVVTNPAVASPPQKRAIPIINPQTGAELETPPLNPSLTSNTNIIKTPFTVLINRPSCPQYPQSLSPSFPQRRAYVPKADYPTTIWSKTRSTSDWSGNLPVSQTENSGSRFSFQEVEEEEEEAEVDKYDWTMSFFNDDEPTCSDQTIQRVTSWISSY